MLAYLQALHYPDYGRPQYKAKKKSANRSHARAKGNITEKIKKRGYIVKR
jgi:hypothetical protein